MRKVLRAAITEFEQTSTSTIDQAVLYLELACAEYMTHDLDSGAARAVASETCSPRYGHVMGAEANLLLGRIYGEVGRNRGGERSTPPPQSS